MGIDRDPANDLVVRWEATACDQRLRAGFGMIDDCGPGVEGEWTLPDYAHVPGATVRPQGGPVATFASQVPELTEPASWQTNRPYLYGFVLYRGGFYWEAHEVWEAVWLRCRPNSSERSLLQALIQLANAGLKAKMAKNNAVSRLLIDAERHLGEAISRAAMDGNECDLMGVDLVPLQLLVMQKISAL